MIKSLQKKFIVTAMTAITVFIVVLFCASNFFNIRFGYRQNTAMLDELLENSEPSPNSAPEGEQIKDGGRILSRPPLEDRRQAAVYFIVYKDADGKITDIDVRNISSVDTEKASEICADVTADKGYTGGFLYKTKYLPDGIYKTVFLNVSEQNYYALRISLILLLVCAACWGLMLLLTIMLSRKAIKPIAENFEKQKRFVADAGHEIKTPLAIIMANTEALELHDGSSKWTSNIKDQIFRLDGLMKNLLLLAKTNSENPEFKKEEVDFSEITSKTIESFLHFADKKGLVFKTEIDEGAKLNAIREQITSLVSVLVDNAVKYSSENSTVYVNLKKDKNIVLTIKNKCDNMPDCPAERLFDRFYRGDSSRNQKSGGYGIGLSAAKEIADYHGGKISAKIEKDNLISFEVKF